MQLANRSISVTSSNPPAYPCGSPEVYTDYADPLQAPYPASSSHGSVALSTAPPAAFPSKPCGVVDGITFSPELGKLAEMTPSEGVPVAQGQTPALSLEAEPVDPATLAQVEKALSEAQDATVIDTQLTNIKELALCGGP